MGVCFGVFVGVGVLVGVTVGVSVGTGVFVRVEVGIGDGGVPGILTCTKIVLAFSLVISNPLKPKKAIIGV